MANILCLIFTAKSFLKWRSLSLLLLFFTMSWASQAESLPPPTDTPEEILQTEIYTEARSPVDGKLLTAAEYIELQEDLAEVIQKLPPESQVSPKVRELIGLLKLRKTLRQIIPFIP